LLQAGDWLAYLDFRSTARAQSAVLIKHDRRDDSAPVGRCVPEYSENAITITNAAKAQPLLTASNRAIR
jgi:hypothetical protein